MPMRYAMLVMILAAGCDRDLSAEERRAIDERERVRAAEIKAQQAQAQAERAAIADFKAGMAAGEREAAEWRGKKRTAAEFRADRARFAARVQSDIAAMEDGVRVEARGADRRTYRVTWLGCSAEALREIVMLENMMTAVQVLKVSRLDCSNGEQVWTQTWR
jgi:hypothetical protein